MKKVVPVIILPLLLIVFTFGISAVSGADSNLVSSKCSGCHSLKRICRELGKKDLAGWTQNVKRMVEMGADLNAAEIAEVSKTLSNAKPEGSSFCN
ncbi:hypothetical protein [Maridesulfovibrio bastinii]|uniref:hypothetical protein n=1 Tax=Maridesulfovibrio bastinii TaxID=47157 RepID=UPI0004214BAC|nr:hypothetical protein [Maridesulfovibrio bastinii]